MFDTDAVLHATTRKGDGATDYTLQHAGEIIAWENRMNNRVQPGTRYSGLMSRDDEYLHWFRSITRRTISPMSNVVNEDYEDHHYYYPTAADFQTLTESSVFGYNTTKAMLEAVPDDMPLSQFQSEYSLVEAMYNMHLNALRETRQGHLVMDEEVNEPSPSPPRYSFRHTEQRVQRAPTQEEDIPESSSRQRKKGKSRRQN